MAGMEGCAALESVGGVACKGLMTGGLEVLAAVQLDEDEDEDEDEVEEGLALAFVPYLGRSASCLKSLDMRCTHTHTNT